MKALSEPIFGDLPAKPRTDWCSIAVKLSERPGQWAQVGTTTSGLGKRHLAAHNLEARRISNGDGTATIWCRYIGPGPTRVLPLPIVVPADVMSAWFPEQVAA